MKGRDSGMPDEAYWNSFFDAEAALEGLLGTHGVQGDVVEFGCGYGTFTLPVARRSSGLVTALDLEPALLERVRNRADEAKLTNVSTQNRDFVLDGTGLAPQTQAHAMIYNLLHLEEPLALLQEAHRVLRPGGTLSVIHWRSDLPTPRGPAVEIRPTPRQCHTWMVEAGFHTIRAVNLQACCPYHFGLVALR